MQHHPVADAESPAPPILIPDELIREILLVLSVKSLLRFKCVCKSWKLIISDPQFVKLHLGRSSANTADLTQSQLLFASNTDEGIFNKSHVSIYSVPLLFSSQNRKGHLYHPMEEGYYVIGACNGLVSFIKWKFRRVNRKSYTCWVCFWNPATRLCSQVSPPVSFCKQQRYTSRTFGFGYDSLNDTYKVVVVFYFKNTLNKWDQGVVKVYNMGRRCWRNIRSFPIAPIKLWLLDENREENGVYVNDTLNWVGRRNTFSDINISDDFIIVSLDLGREVYSQIAPPPYIICDAASLYKEPTLGVSKDSLYVLYSHPSEMSFVVWQMKHRVWTQLFNITTPFCFDTYWFVCFENDEVLLISFDEVALYNERNDKLKHSEYGRVSYNVYHQNIYGYYVESLVSPV